MIKKPFHYFDSAIEKTLIQLFCNSLPAAGKIFVSYDTDDETRKGLMVNVPEVITRLGFLLFNNGCTWFKDWYFPEGGFEGGQKLQGKKPVSSIQKGDQLKKLHSEINRYLSSKKTIQTHTPIEKKAINRGRKMFKKIRSILSFHNTCITVKRENPAISHYFTDSASLLQYSTFPFFINSSS